MDPPDSLPESRRQPRHAFLQSSHGDQPVALPGRLPDAEGTAGHQARCGGWPQRFWHGAFSPRPVPVPAGDPLRILRASRPAAPLLPPGIPAFRNGPFARRSQNATNLLSLQACTAGYSPTRWQRSLFPTEYQHKIATIFDGIDQEFWYRRPVPRRIGNVSAIPAGTRIVTYCSYGLEAARGFDIFMKVARRICEARSDVLFVVVGADRAYYGEDRRYIQENSFCQHVLARDQYGLTRFIF